MFGTNRAVQVNKMVRDLKVQIYKEEGLNYLCSKNKGADQMCGSVQLICALFLH